MSKEKVRIRVRLSQEEKVVLERRSRQCGLSQAEFIRQLCKGRQPRPQPPEGFWKLLDGLYYVHTGFQECIPYEPSAADVCRQIEQLVLDLEEAV